MDAIKATSYQYVSKEKIPDFLMCGICSCPIVDPLRAPCNHYFCYSCLYMYFMPEEVVVKSCPTCEKEIILSSIMPETHPLILQQLNSLQIYCTKKENGCEWKGPRSNLKDHFQLSCTTIECENKSKGCKWKGYLKNREVHLENECEFVKVFCKHRKIFQCEFSTERKFISSHESNCQKYLDYAKQIKIENEKAQESQKFIKEREEIQKNLIERKEEVLSDRPIKFNAGGTHFTTSLKTLGADQSSLLYSLFIGYFNKTIPPTTSNNNNSNGNKRGREEEIFLDCDAKSFSHILFWLRSGELPMDLKEKEIQYIRVTSRYLNLTSLLSYLPIYFPSLPQNFTEFSAILAKSQNKSSHLFAPSLVIYDQFDNDKITTETNSQNNPPNKKRKLEELNNGSNLIGMNRIILTSAQLTSLLPNINKDVKSMRKKVDLRRRDFSKESAVGLQLKNVLFNESLFKDSKLAYCDFTSSDFNRSNFENAILKASNFRNCNLSNCNFKNANLSNADLSSDLSNSNLSNANLSNANLWSADLSNANLSSADLSKVNLTNANLSNANLSHCNLSNAILTNCNLSGAILKGANLIRSTLRNANFDNTILLETNFSHCDLSSMKLTETDLISCNFSSSYLTATDFTGSNITNVNFTKATITKADFSNTTGCPLPTFCDSHPYGIPQKLILRCFDCCNVMVNSVIVRKLNGSSAFVCICNNCRAQLFHETKK